jgi:hypothetical protein
MPCEWPVPREIEVPQHHGGCPVEASDIMSCALDAHRESAARSFGATAMGFHGLIRATEDVDLLVRALPENIDRLRAALRDAYEGDPEIAEIRTDDLLGEYPAVRYYPPTGDLYFDILTRLGDAARFETVEAEIRTVDGIRVPVATPRALYRLKRGTIRPLDQQDAAALRNRFNLREDE